MLIRTDGAIRQTLLRSPTRPRTPPSGVDVGMHGCRYVDVWVWCFVCVCVCVVRLSFSSLSLARYARLGCCQPLSCAIMAFCRRVPSRSNHFLRPIHVVIIRTTKNPVLNIRGLPFVRGNLLGLNPQTSWLLCYCGLGVRLNAEPYFSFQMRSHHNTIVCHITLQCMLHYIYIYIYIYYRYRYQCIIYCSMMWYTFV